MTQARLTLAEGARYGDVSRGTGNEILIDDGLETAIAISLHTDIAATSDDGLPMDERRGYWADVIEEEQDAPIGSRLWLVARQTLTAETLEQAKAAALESVQWMVDVGAVGAFSCEAERVSTSTDHADMTLSVYRPGETSPYYTYTWELHFAVE